MKKSSIYILASTLLFINCGSETKANSVNENNTSMSTEVEETVVTEDSTTNEALEITRIEKLDNSEKTTEKITPAKKNIIQPKEEVIELEEEPKETIEPWQNISKQAIIEEVETTEPVAPTFNHQAFDELLKKYVTSSGKVNYKGIKSEVSKLDAYIKELDVQYANLNSWSKNKQLAFWINVYNAHTIKLIIDNYPVASITKLKGGKPWDYKFIKLGDKTYTLNEVENSIIRPKYNEPRIHFAVNCAAKSCPKLMNKAWTEENINSALTTQTKAFLANTTENTLGAKEVKLSKIFDWYNTDFTKNGSLISFIKKYSSATINDDAKVTYNEYNWELNE